MQFSIVAVTTLIDDTHFRRLLKVINPWVHYLCLDM